MEERERRIGENEALFREVNERVAKLSENMQVTTELTAFLCECGDEACHERIEMTLEEYERLRTEPADFAISPGHEVADVEVVVEKNERFWVVRKHKGEAAELAEELDPRAL